MINNKNSSGFATALILGIGSLALMLVGSFSVLFLSNQNQDIRQQASESATCGSSSSSYSCNSRPGCTWIPDQVYRDLGECKGTPKKYCNDQVQDDCDRNSLRCIPDFSGGKCEIIIDLGECTQGQFQCSGDNSSKFCKTNGGWSVPVSCASGEQCNSATGKCANKYCNEQVQDDCDRNSLGCIPDFNGGKCEERIDLGQCTQGQFQCSGTNASKYCKTNGGWSIPAQCGLNKQCNSDTGKCASKYCNEQVQDDCDRNSLGCIPDFNGGKCEERIDLGQCTQGQFQCSGTNASKYCKTNGGWSDPVSCGSNKQCNSTTGKCIDPYCDDQVKDDCDRNSLRCIPDFSGGKCEERIDLGQCTQGQFQCSGTNASKYCKTNGEWSNPVGCGLNKQCTSATGKCIDPYCNDQVQDDCDRNALRCIPDYNGGSCEDRVDLGECTQGQFQCSGTNASKYCKTNGGWSDPVSCNENFVCKSTSGKCEYVEPTGAYCQELCLADGNTASECSGLPSCPKEIGVVNACTNKSEGDICVSGGKVGQCKFNGSQIGSCNLYPDKVAIGSTCGTNAYNKKCVDGYECKDNICKEKVTFLPILGEGEVCIDNAECRSGNCNRGLCEYSDVNSYDTTALQEVEIITYANNSELCTGTREECAVIAQQVYQEVKRSGEPACRVNYRMQVPGSSSSDADKYCSDAANGAIALATVVTGASVAAPISGAITTGSQYAVAYGTNAAYQLGGWALANTGASSIAGYTASGILAAQRILNSPTTSTIVRSLSTAADAYGFYETSSACQKDVSSTECAAGVVAFQLGLFDFGQVDDVLLRPVGNKIQNSVDNLTTMGQVIDENGNIISLKNVLGEGGGGAAYSGIDSNGNQIVVKMLNNEGPAFEGTELTVEQLARSEFNTLAERNALSDVYAKPGTLVRDEKGNVIGYSLEKINGIEPTKYKRYTNPGNPLVPERDILIGPRIPDNVSQNFLNTMKASEMPHGDLLDPFTFQVKGSNIIFERQGGIPGLRNNSYLAALSPKIGGEVTGIRLIDPFISDQIHTINPDLVRYTDGLQGMADRELYALEEWLTYSTPDKSFVEALKLNNAAIKEKAQNNLFSDSPNQYLPTYRYDSDLVPN